MLRTLTLAVVALPALAQAESATWSTDATVGATEVQYTLSIQCPAVSFVCSLIDGYSDVQVSSATGSGTLDVDDAADEIQLDTDSTQDVGSGPEPAFLTLSGSDLVFASVPFAGVPEIANPLVFSLSSPPIPVWGLDLGLLGDTPFSQTLDLAGTADVVGDLELSLSSIDVPPGPALLTGELRVLGDVDLDGRVDVELRDLSASATVQIPAFIGGEAVTIDVTADLTANLSVQVGEAGPAAPVPALGPWPGVLLAMALAGGARCRLRARASGGPANRKS